MKKTLLFVMLGLCCGLVAQNLMQNPKFEGMAAGKVPGWTVHGSTVQVNAIPGGMLLKNTEAGKNATLSQSMSKLESGVPLLLECDAQAEKLTSIQVYVEHVIAGKDGKDTWSSSGTAPIKIGTGVYHRRLAFVIPDKPKNTYFAIRSCEGLPVKFTNLVIRKAKQRPELGGTWDMEELEEGPNGSVIVPGGKVGVLANVPVTPSKHYRLSYTSTGLGSTGSDYPFHELVTQILPKVQGAYNFNDVRNVAMPKAQQFFVPPEATFKTIRIEFRPNTKGKIQFEQFRLEEVVPDPRDEWRFYLTEPFYRETIYASNDKGIVRGELEAKGAARANVEIKGVGKTSFELTDGKGSFEIKAANLADGKYPVVCEACDKDGKPLKTFELTLRHVPQNVQEVLGRPNGYFSINGKPFFPLTEWRLSFRSDAGCYYAAKHGVNSYFHHFNTNVEKSLAQLDQAHKFGFKIIGVSGIASSEDPAKFSVFAKRLASIYTPEVRNHPAFFGYFLVDEPLWNGRSYFPIAATYEYMKDYDPYHPTWINAAPRNEVPELRPYAAACDIWGADIYPVPYPNSHSGLDDKGLTSVGKYCARMADCVYGRKPVWMALQGFAWAGLKKETPVEKHIYPNDAQMRFMAMDAMLNCCTGYGLWGTYTIKSPAFYDTIFRTTKELNELSALFVLGKQLPDLPGRTKTRIVPITLNSDTFYFILNLTESCQKTKFSVENCAELQVYADGSKLVAEDGAFQVSLTPFQVIVCGTAKQLPPPVNPPVAIHKELETAENPVPGFLAEMLKKAAALKPYKGTANWIWNGAEAKNAGSCCIIAKTFQVTDATKGAILRAATDDLAIIYLNGKEIGKSDEWSVMHQFNLKDALVAGENVLMVKCEDAGTLPCGFLAEIEVEGKLVARTDASWLSISTTHKAPMPGAGALKDFQPSLIIAPYGSGAWGKNVFFE